MTEGPGKVISLPFTGLALSVRRSEKASVARPWNGTKTKDLGMGKCLRKFLSPHPFDKFENLPLCAARGECALPLCGTQGYINGVSRLPNHPAMRLRMGIFFQRSGVSR